MDVLTELQKKFLAAMSATRLKESFWLTGGTALSAFYLKHRLSDDLDFFTAEPGAIPGLIPELEKVAPSLGATLTVRRQFRSYLEIVLDSEGERLRIDFSVDSPYRLEPARIFPPGRSRSTTPSTSPATSSRPCSIGTTRRISSTSTSSIEKSSRFSA